MSKFTRLGCGLWMVVAGLALSVPCGADDDDRRWRGSAQGEAVDILENGDHIVAFEGRASHLGRYTATASYGFPLPDSFYFAGSGVFTAANGDKLHFVIEGDFTEFDPVQVFDGTLTVIGGTGRFRDARGSAKLAGEAPHDGTFEFTFRGTLAYGEDD